MRIHVSGLVQGVFFRSSTKKKADALGLKGWVRNEKDGSVLIEVEGPEDEMEEFILWCKTGPPTARVNDLKSESIPNKDFSGFEIAY